MFEDMYTFTARYEERCNVYFGKIEEAPAYISAYNDSKYVVVIDKRVYELWESTIRKLFLQTPKSLGVIVVDEGEAAKHETQLAVIVDALQNFELNRRDKLVIIGGGACCDVGGLAAACFMRGIPHVLIPTTLLAMVDAAHGGKVAINLQRGKNLFGGFHTPGVVWIDFAFLNTLPTRETIQAMAEVVKIAIIMDDINFFIQLEEFSKKGDAAYNDYESLASIVKYCVLAKIQLMEPDWRERDLDRLLNAGHAVAHSLETVFNFDRTALGHGEAVAIGLATKVRFSLSKGFINENDASRIIALLKALKLPTSIQLTKQEYDLAMEGLSVQKRIRDRNLRLVIPKTSCSSFIYHEEDATDVLKFLNENSKFYIQG